MIDKKLVLRMSLAILAATTQVGTAAAQGEGGDSEKSVAEQIQALTADLVEREKELEELRKGVAKADGSVAAEALESELTEKQSRFRREVAELTELVLQGADAGTDTANARALATRLLEDDATRIRDRTKDVNAEVLELADKVENGPPEEAEKARIGRDNKIVDSNDLVSQLHDNIGQRAKLGLDVGSDTEIITELLKVRSNFTAGYLQSTKEEIDDISSRPGLAEDAEAQQALAGLNDRRDILAESQRLNVSLMDEYGLETAELRQGIISSTGKISEDVLNKDVAMGLAEEWIADAGDWLRTNGAAIIFQIAIAILVFVLFWIAAGIGRGLVRRALARSKVQMSHLARDFFIKTTGRIILLLGLIVAIAQLGVQVGPVLAGLGIAGFVIGFALQDTLSNFASGMMILIYRPFDVGDVIEAGGVMGKVHEMNLVSTMVLTFDNQLLVVPNTQIWGGVIRNVTHQDTRRVDLVFGIGYSDDIPHAEKVLTEIVESHEKVMKDPEPVVRLHELADSSVNFVVRPWAKTDDYWDVYWDITREVKRRFDEEGISIPFPQRDVHVFRDEDPGDASTGDEQRSSTTESAQDVAPGDADTEE